MLNLISYNLNGIGYTKRWVKEKRQRFQTLLLSDRKLDCEAKFIIKSLNNYCTKISPLQKYRLNNL